MSEKFDHFLKSVRQPESHSGVVRFADELAKTIKIEFRDQGEEKVLERIFNFYRRILDAEGNGEKLYISRNVSGKEVQDETWKDLSPLKVMVNVFNGNQGNTYREFFGDKYSTNSNAKIEIVIPGEFYSTFELSRLTIKSYDENFYNDPDLFFNCLFSFYFYCRMNSRTGITYATKGVNGIKKISFE